MVSATATTPALDVRALIPAQRHALIFDRVAELGAGAGTPPAPLSSRSTRR